MAPRTLRPGMTVLAPVPTVGAIVRYVHQLDDGGPPIAVAAIVAGVQEAGKPDSALYLMLVFPGTPFMFNVPFDQTADRVNSWHWPEHPQPVQMFIPGVADE